jgi:hypothetical protein
VRNCPGMQARTAGTLAVDAIFVPVNSIDHDGEGSVIYLKFRTRLHDCRPVQQRAAVM